MEFDVIVIGAGPIGIVTACSLKAIDDKLKICVVDKRPVPVRNHGLKINADSVLAIKGILDKYLHRESSNAKNIQELQTIFEGWKDNFIRTNQIENELGKVASGMGIIVLRDKQYEVTVSNFQDLCSESENEDELSAIFRNAPIIIGADGSHSVVRQVAMDNKFSHKEVLRHVVELKFQSPGETRPRGYKEASSASIKHGTLNFETMSHDLNSDTKPVTLHIFVDENTYNDLRIVGDDDKMKGVFGNPWNFSELQKLSETNYNIKCVYDQIKAYFDKIEMRHGWYYNEQITTLSMEVYRSERSAVKFHDKYIS